MLRKLVVLVAVTDVLWRELWWAQRMFKPIEIVPCYSLMTMRSCFCCCCYSTFKSVQTFISATTTTILSIRISKYNNNLSACYAYVNKWSLYVLVCVFRGNKRMLFCFFVSFLFELLFACQEKKNWKQYLRKMKGEKLFWYLANDTK